MIEKAKFGKGLVYGSVFSLGIWIVMFEVIYTFVK